MNTIVYFRVTKGKHKEAFALFPIYIKPSGKLGIVYTRERGWELTDYNYLLYSRPARAGEYECLRVRLEDMGNKLTIHKTLCDFKKNLAISKENNC